MKKTGTLVLMYALLVFAGGLIGHFKSQSLPSLISGTIFGTLLIFSSWAMLNKKRWGQWASLFLSFVLDAFFTWRFAKTLKFFPSGLMSLISLAMVIILALRINMYYRRK